MLEDATEPETEESGTVRSRTGRVLVAGAAVLVGLLAVVHLGMVLLHVAPDNVVSRQYDEALDGYIRPEFVQNWKLFAPEPLHTNARVEARARLRGQDGALSTTGWIDVSAAEIEMTRYNLVPSHARNQLRKGWRIYLQTHDGENRAYNTAGLLLESYLKRVALMRLSHELPAAAIERVQLRSASTPVKEPAWSVRAPRSGTSHRVLPWWDVAAGDFPEGSAR
ncbi:MAG: DUF5819 family protein [Thermocrispum sp.]